MANNIEQSFNSVYSFYGSRSIERALSLNANHGKVHDLLSSYLENRIQKCIINWFISESRTLQCGIPQGTIFRPLLLLLYINDFPNCLSTSTSYDDDTHLTYAGTNIP